jgi:hypothetical protein
VTELAEFARHEFRLSKRDKDGKSLRETLEVVERMTGNMPQEGINPVEFPDLLYDLWNWFLKLSTGRGGGMGPTPIDEQNIGWFFHNRRITPQCWQLDAIRMLDSIALEILLD